MLDFVEVHNKLEDVKKPSVKLKDKTIPVIAISDNFHCPGIPPNTTRYKGKYSMYPGISRLMFLSPC